MSKRKRPSQRVRVSGQHPPFPRRAELCMAFGLTALGTVRKLPLQLCAQLARWLIDSTA